MLSLCKDSRGLNNSNSTLGCIIAMLGKNGVNYLHVRDTSKALDF